MADAAIGQLIYGDGAHMSLVADGEADLIVTSPPYFSAQTERLLRAPRKAQTELETVRREVVEFALTLRPVFEEMFRVLRPGRKLVLQTKDLRYGDYLVALVCLHREIAESVGFRLITRILWQRSFDSPRHASRTRLLAHARRIGGFRSFDTEEFLVFARPNGHLTRTDTAVPLPEAELREALSPLWRLPGPGRSAHPFASPARVVRRFVALYSAPGDLVIDPFAGRGTTIRVATSMGRRSIGYEIDQSHAEGGAQAIKGAVERGAQ